MCLKEEYLRTAGRNVMHCKIETDREWWAIRQNESAHTVSHLVESVVLAHQQIPYCSMNGIQIKSETQPASRSVFYYGIKCLSLQIG